MKFVKFIIICIVVFCVTVTAISLLIPSHVRISRAINVAPGNDSVLSKICDLNRWKDWHPQMQQINLTDTLSLYGRITQAKAAGVLLSVLNCNNDSVTVQMQKGKKPITNNWKLLKHGANDSLTLQNYMDFDFAWYPWEKFSSLLLDGSYGPVMEEGLRRLSK